MSSTQSRLRRPQHDLPVDHLRVATASLDVVLLSGQNYAEDGDCGARRPHRHDYHELLWSRRGSGSHLIDGEPSSVEPGLLTVIGRGQVHVFERGEGIDGALVRFGDEMLRIDAMARVDPAWLVGFQGPHAVRVPDEDAARLDALVVSLAEETRRVADSVSLDVQRHLLCTLLLWVARWHDERRLEPRDGDDAALHLYRRFIDVLERDYTSHHKARHYADELAVPQAVLSRALAQVTGRRTKELITERRMLEAARLLRFTDHAVGEVASRAGFDDQLYFSRAFKRHYGHSPMDYREHVRGR